MQKEDLIGKRVLDVLSTSPRAIHRPLIKCCLTLLKVTAFEELFFSKTVLLFFRSLLTAKSSSLVSREERKASFARK
jgi:hypothetical protein